jgi:hypothetical protein
MNGTWTKIKLGIIEHLKRPVDDWTVRKCFHKSFGDNKRLHIGLMVGIRILTIRALMLVLRICLRKCLGEFNCCLNSRSMSFIAILI